MFYWLWVCPHQISDDAHVRHVEGSLETIELLEIDERLRNSPVHAEDALVDQSSQRHRVEWQLEDLVNGRAEAKG